MKIASVAAPTTAAMPYCTAASLRVARADLPVATEVIITQLPAAEAMSAT